MLKYGVYTEHIIEIDLLKNQRAKIKQYKNK